MTNMPRPRPPHLHRETNRHGNVVWYVRVGKGPRIRIKAGYGTPEFDDAYQAAINSETPRPRGKAAHGTLAWLWTLYRQTGAWTELSIATRRQRENIMRIVLTTGGDQPLSRITGRAITQGIERRKPYQARHFVDTMHGMFKWAVAAEHVRSDPTVGKAVAKPKTKGFPVWTEEELEQYERHWPIGTRERVMFGVYCFAGLRRGDAARLGRQHIRNGVIEIDTEKTGTRVTIPVLPELAEIIAAGPIGSCPSSPVRKASRSGRRCLETYSRKPARPPAFMANRRMGSARRPPRARRTTAPQWRRWKRYSDGKVDRWLRSIRALLTDAN